MDIVIVDDEALARRRLLKMVNDLGFDVVAEASNSEEAYQTVQKYDPALLLLDIDMPGESGLQLAHRISELETPPAIIFTTAYDQFALEAFETHAAGYLLKPIQRQQLKKALEKAQVVNKLQSDFLLREQTKTASVEHITVKSHRGMELIPFHNIRCFVADQKCVMIVTTEGKSIIDKTLKQLEQSFNHKFIRIHRNAMVSIEHIQGLSRDAEGHYRVRLSDVEEEPMVSRRYTNQVKQLLDQR